MARTARSDYGGPKLAYVLDGRQQLIVHCFEKTKLDCVTGNHQPIGPASGPLTAETWKRAFDAWKTAAVNKGDAPGQASTSPRAAPTIRCLPLPVFTDEAGDRRRSDRGGARRSPARLRRPRLRPGAHRVVCPASRRAEVRASAAARRAVHWRGRCACSRRSAPRAAILPGPVYLALDRQLSRKDIDQDPARRPSQHRAEIRCSRRREIGFLGEVFNFMADRRIGDPSRQTREGGGSSRCFEVAKAIQETLVPEDVEAGGHLAR